MTNLSIDDIMNTIYNFIQSHNIEDRDLKSKLYVSCLGSEIDKREIIIMLNEVYIYHKLQQNLVYIDGLQEKGQDIIIQYNPDLPIIRMHIYNLLQILTPYERTIIILEFYDNLSLKEISVELNDTIEHITLTRKSALERLKNNAGDLIDYLHIL